MVSDPVYLPFVTSKGADPHDDDENMEATRMKVLKPILYQLVHVIKIESNTCMLQRTYMNMQICPLQPAHLQTLKTWILIEARSVCSLTHAQNH